jgi:hypothetical protein
VLLVIIGGSQAEALWAFQLILVIILVCWRILPYHETSGMAKFENCRDAVFDRRCLLRIRRREHQVVNEAILGQT